MFQQKPIFGWKLTLTMMPVGLWMSWTQLLLLLTFCPPGPQPLMKFSSISSSLRCTSWYSRTKSTARCDLKLIKEPAITKCPFKFLGIKHGRIVFTPFHKRAAKGNMSSIFNIRKLSSQNSTNNRLSLGKWIARPFWNVFFRGKRGRFKLVSCYLMQHAPSSLRRLRNILKWLRLRELHWFSLLVEWCIFICNRPAKTSRMCKGLSGR